MPRVLLTLRKGEEVKYLSHRDFVRAFEFAQRRARIPVAYSEGFNPRPRMSFGQATSLGATSDDERIVVDLTRPEPKIAEKLNRELPPGMKVLSSEVMPDGAKPLAGLTASEFRIKFCADPVALKQAVSELLAAKEVRAARIRDGRKKEIDIRPHILSAEVSDSEVTVSLSSEGAGPRDFVSALAEKVSGLIVEKVHRVRQYRNLDNSR
ncbi:MAG: TIGR03936 family radical SAM-associated protein [Armatimonadota bacterium]